MVHPGNGILLWSNIEQSPRHIVKIDQGGRGPVQNGDYSLRPLGTGEGGRAADSARMRRLFLERHRRNQYQ